VSRSDVSTGLFSAKIAIEKWLAQTHAALQQHRRERLGTMVAVNGVTPDCDLSSPFTKTTFPVIVPFCSVPFASSVPPDHPWPGNWIEFPVTLPSSLSPSRLPLSFSPVCSSSIMK